jgi:peptidoglycan/LPS O-acetylase OafA/YrhL
MSESRKEGNGLTTAMRWVARLIALVAVGLFILFAVQVGTKVFPGLAWTHPQGLPLLMVLFAALVGGLVAWRWELAGGIVTFAGSIVIMALVCVGSGTDMLYCAFLFSLPLFAAGALYLGCCWRKSKADQPAASTSGV